MNSFTCNVMIKGYINITKIFIYFLSFSIFLKLFLLSIAGPVNLGSDAPYLAPHNDLMSQRSSPDSVLSLASDAYGPPRSSSAGFPTSLSGHPAMPETQVWWRHAPYLAPPLPVSSDSWKKTGILAHCTVLKKIVYETCL